MDEKKSLADANISDVKDETPAVPEAEKKEEQQPEPAKEEPVQQTENQNEVKEQESQPHHDTEEQKPEEKKEPEKPPQQVKETAKPRFNVPRREHKKINLRKTASKLKILHPLHIKRKLQHYRVEYSRVLHLARKPTKTEYRELAIMVAVGTSIIGAIGFVVQTIIQFI